MRRLFWLSGSGVVIFIISAVILAVPVMEALFSALYSVALISIAVVNVAEVAGREKKKVK